MLHVFTSTVMLHSCLFQQSPISNIVTSRLMKQEKKCLYFNAHKYSPPSQKSGVVSRLYTFQHVLWWFLIETHLFTLWRKSTNSYWFFFPFPSLAFTCMLATFQQSALLHSEIANLFHVIYWDYDGYHS